MFLHCKMLSNLVAPKKSFSKFLNEIQRDLMFLPFVIKKKDKMLVGALLSTGNHIVGKSREKTLSRGK